jgi:two-component system vancomycin resistance associated response regulator VraR
VPFASWPRLKNGEQAVRLAPEKAPNVILMDIFMPVMNGIAATQQIKREHPEIKVILFTGSEQDEGEIAKAFAAGADAYCKKDIKIAQLLRCSPEIGPGNKLQIGSFHEIDERS